MKYELKEINKKQLLENLDTIWDLYKSTVVTGFPRKINTYDELCFEMERTYNKPDNKILTCYEKDRLVGIMKIEPLMTEKYLESKWYYIDRDYNYNDISMLFMEYLEKNYAGFEADFVFFSDNKNAVDFFPKHGFSIDDDNTEFNLHQCDFSCKSISESVKKITEDDIDRYVNFFDKYSGGMYWNGQRIKENLDVWRLYTYESENEIKACICVKMLPVRNNKRNAEIFATFIEDINGFKEIEEELISRAMTDVFSENIQMVYYFVGNDDRLEKEIVKSIGFTEIDSYICFRRESL